MIKTSLYKSIHRSIRCHDRWDEQPIDQLVRGKSAVDPEMFESWIYGEIVRKGKKVVHYL